MAVFWLAVTVAGVLLAGQATRRFSSTKELPALPSYRAAEVLQHSYAKRVPVIGQRHQVLVSSGTGNGPSKVAGDRHSRSVSQVSSGNGDAAVLPASYPVPQAR